MIDKKVILLIDDEEIILETISEILEESVDKIHTAKNGREAIKVIKENPDILCVISDINMPELGGLETLKEVRELGNEVPFIFYTAHGNNDIIKEAARYGMFDFLHKPKLENLVSTVKRGLIHGFAIQNGDYAKDYEPEDYASLLKEVNSIS